MSEVQKSYLPSCWNDDLRMQALFSVFRKKELNPTGWQEKMDFWIKAINDYSKKMKRAVISANDIRNAFVKGSRYPNCIDEVLDHMYEQRMLADAEQFANPPSNSWIGWGYNGIKKSVSWGYSFAMSFIKEQPEKQSKPSRYVVLDVVKDLADSLIRRHEDLKQKDKVNHVMETSDFQAFCKDICTGESFEYALMFLQQEKKVLLFFEEDKQYVKFPKDDNDKANVSEADKAVIRLRQSIELVTKQVEILEKEINSCNVETKQLINAGNKAKAMCVLKKRKRLETELKRKAASMDNLDALLIQLLNADSGKHVLEAYNTGVAAMKNCLTKDLDLNKVDTTMADIQEMADELTDIQNMMSKSVGSDGDSDLEAELDDILSPGKGKTHPAATKQNADEELIRRLNALKQPVATVSPTSSANRSEARLRHAVPLK